jgi:hypothetical protein
MEPRYVIRLRSRRYRGVLFGVTEIRRLADDALVYEEWADPRGKGLPSDVARALRLLEAAPDDQAEAIIEAIKHDRMRAAVARLPTLEELGLTQEERAALGIG